jgi:hypothetical protein
VFSSSLLLFTVSFVEFLRQKSPLISVIHFKHFQECLLSNDDEEEDSDTHLSSMNLSFVDFQSEMSREKDSEKLVLKIRDYRKGFQPI